MIKVSVLYPNAPGARFDHAYYRDSHMPLVKRRMGDYCQSYSIDKGFPTDAPPPFLCICHIFCTSLEDFQAGFGPYQQEFMADIPNYTDQSPIVQFSEVVPI